MKLNRYDIEAIAKGRVKRSEAKKSNQWLIGVIIGVVIGLLIAFRVSAIGGYGIWIATMIAFIFYQNGVTKKQNIAVRRLVKEWEQEVNGTTKSQ